MFQLYSGKAMVEAFKRTASTAFAQGVAVDLTSGLATVATGSSTKIAGVSNEVVDSTHTDLTGVTNNYATSTYMQVIYPLDETIFIADVTGGTIATANIGTQYDTAANGLSVNVGATTNKNWTLVDVISTTKGLFKIATALNTK